MPIQHFLAISWQEQVTFQDDEVCFVLDQHRLSFYSASSQKQVYNLILRCIHGNSFSESEILWFECTLKMS
jgi:hypothetical protein